MCIRTSVSRTRLRFLPGSRVLDPAVFSCKGSAVLSSLRAWFQREVFWCVGCGVLSVEMSVIQSVHVAVPPRSLH